MANNMIFGFASSSHPKEFNMDIIASLLAANANNGIKADYYTPMDLEILQDSPAVMFVERYSNPTKDLTRACVGVHGLTPLDRDGFGGPRSVGLIGSLASKTLSSVLYVAGYKIQMFNKLDAKTQQYVTFNVLPIEWHTKMKDPAFQCRFFVMTPFGKTFDMALINGEFDINDPMWDISDTAVEI